MGVKYTGDVVIYLKAKWDSCAGYEKQSRHFILNVKMQSY